MNLLGKSSDPDFWKQVKEKKCYKNFVEEALNLYENNKFENDIIPSVCYDDYKTFWVNGDRDIYESKYFRKRTVLNTSAVLSMIYPQNKEYINALQNVIFAILDEYSWCLPAHQRTLEVNNNSKIDLFASETGEALSEIYTLLYDRLDPLIKDRIRVEIDRRIITPFINSEKYDWWELGNTNWTAVCMGSVGCTIMLMRPDLITEKMLCRFDASMNTFLKGFSKEGFCLEGCNYWDYGFGFFVVFADMIKTFTNGKINYFLRDDVKKISTFLQKMFLSGKACVSFSDSDRTVKYRVSILHRLKTEYPDDVLIYPHEYSFNNDHCARWCLYIRSVTWLNDKYYNNPVKDPEFECFAPDAQWFIKRTKKYGFAAKGGTNGTSHNHNDVGSFIFAKNGEQILCDLSKGKYCRQYFDIKDRYSFLETSSKGHSVPIYNGEYQKYGKEYKAENTKFENGIFSCDIASAYGIEGFNSCLRSFRFNDDSVTMKDEFDSDNGNKITERFVSVIAPQKFESFIKINDCILKYNPNDVELHINETKSSLGTDVYLIDFDLNEGIKEFTLIIK